MLATWLLIGFAGLLAFANGANDTFKGVATLAGSGATTHRRALLWALLTTGLGSVTALGLAQGLLTAFSGKGLVDAAVLAQPGFPLAVASAAGATVLIATWTGFPISTTHALLGGLLGAGWMAGPGRLNLSAAVGGFLWPLLTSPLLAIAGAFLVYPAAIRFARRFGLRGEACVCVEIADAPTEPMQSLAGVVALDEALPRLQACDATDKGGREGITAGRVVDGLHFLSGGAVGFARGLNDTPKIAAILIMGRQFGAPAALGSVALLMAVGGWLSARRVAETLSYRVTDMDAGQGLTANLVTSGLVIGASRLGLPVSTTHVSCGALFGIGAVSRRAHWSSIRRILLAWVLTLPLAAGLAALVYSFQ